MLGGALSSWADGNSQLASNALNDGGVVDLRENTSVTLENINQHVPTGGATTVILPNGWTEAEVKTAGEKLKNNSISFGTAVSTTNSPETTDITRNYYINDGGDRVYVANTGGINIDITETFYTSDNTLKFKESYSAYDDFNNQEVRVSSDNPAIQDGYYFPDVIQNVKFTPFASYNDQVIQGGKVIKKDNKYYTEINGDASNNYQPREVEVSSWKYQYNGSWYDFSGNDNELQYNGEWDVRGTIDNSNHLISFKVDTYYVYSYTKGNGETKDTPRSKVELTEYTDSYQKYYTVYTETITAPKWTKLYAYVNTAGTLDNAIADATIIPNVTTQVTLIGNINNDDLAELKTVNFSSVEYLSMKDAVLDGDITTIGSKPTAAIILPKIKDGESTRNINNKELGTIQDNQVVSIPGQYGHTYDKYHCLSYFDKDYPTKMYIYAFDATVAKLGNDVSNNTAITFIPKYKTDGDFAEFLGQSASSEDLDAFRVALGQLPAISMDLSIVHNNMYPDFRHLNAHTHYLTVPGNVQNNNVYGESVDFTCETETSVYKYPSTVWVVSAYRVDAADQYALDGNGNKIPRTDNNGQTIYEEDNVTPKYQRTGYGTYIHYAGKFLQATEPTNLIYVRSGVTAAEGEAVPSSLLDGAKNYFTNEQLYATRQIFIGSYNEAEIAKIDGKIHGNVFDFMTGTSFTTVTVGEGNAAKTLDCVVNLDNDNVKYILLPDNHEADINATSPNSCSFSGKCAGLLCVGAYNTTTNTLTTWSSAPGNVYSVTSMIRPQKTNRGNNLICTSLENVVMSGQLNWYDISTNTGNGKNNGLENATIKSADLTNAYFPDNSDMVFSTASWSNIEHLYLPTDERMNTIPDESMYQFQSLVELCIPYNYEHIGVNAFYNSHIPTITTTDANGNLYVGGTKVKSILNGIYYDKDGIVIPNNGVNTYTLSENLKSISTGAFNTLHGDLTDVYVLATTAPTCAADAFTKGMYDGWGGFKGNDDHPLSRATYNNNGVLFTMLHFPANVTLAQAKNYTDITRDYTLWDETGAYDGQGNLRVWPNMTEFYRAFRQAIHGVTWNANGWNTTRSAGGNVNDIQNLPSSYTAYVMDEQGQFVLDGEGNKTTAVYEPTNLYDANVNFTAANVIPATTTEAGEGNTYDTQYMGWHQFVLADYYRYKEVEKDANATYVDGQWYTICIPYDLTEEEVINLMGAPKNATYSGYGCKIASGDNAGCHLPTVYSLKKVTREYPNITLGFSQELMNQIANNNKDLVFNNSDGTIDLAEYNYQSNKEGKILIKGGYPYLIRPIFPETVKDELGNVVNFNEADIVKGNLGKYILSVSSFTENDLGNKYEDEVAIPIISQKLIATNQGGTQINTKEAVKDENNNVLVAANQPYYYFFQGTYTKQTMPKAYFIYNGLWYRNTKDNRDWDSFTAIIGGKTTADGASIINSSGSKTGKDNFSTYFVSFKSYSDKFTQSQENGVKFNITFEDEDGFDEVVAIDQINGESFNSNVNGPVYNMAGQRVGTSLEGLSKGLYIVNGKKVVVK